MGHFGKPQCDTAVILNVVKNLITLWDTSLSLSVTNVKKQVYLNSVFQGKRNRIVKS